jgi:hypothetical protein
VQASTISSPGGEESRVGGGADAYKAGQPARHGFSVRPGRCVMGVARVVEAGAELGWQVEITPVRVVDEVVTFRLVWERTRSDGKASSQPKGDMEMTLRPGESMPIDSAFHTCADRQDVIGTSLRASVVRYPDPDYDRRLVGVDLWLIEKQRDGTERSMPLALRGLYHRPIPFYFDSLTEGAMTRDLFGELTVAKGSGTSKAQITIRSRITDPNLPPGRPFPRETTATVPINPDEVVSVELPQLVDGTSAAFSSRALSLRIRLRQLR